LPPRLGGRLFQPFTCGSHGSEQGLGLGLYIVSEIAKAHGGTIVVESDANRTRFVLTLSLSPS
jgi:sigma-B regulation protein RsbU (phosphoserine phosphatase)